MILQCLCVYVSRLRWSREAALRCCCWSMSRVEVSRAWTWSVASANYSTPTRSTTSWTADRCLGLYRPAASSATGGLATLLDNLAKSGNLRVVRGKVGENRKSQGKCVLACMKFGQLVLRKIVEIVATGCQILRLKCTKFNFSCGCAPGPAGGAYSTPPVPLADLRGPTSKGGEESNSELFHWSLLKNTFVIVVTVYMSIAVRNNMHFVSIATVERVDTP